MIRSASALVVMILGLSITLSFHRPERLDEASMGSARGSGGATVKNMNYSCSQAEIDNLNQSAPPTYVLIGGGGGCNAKNNGAPCIRCTFTNEPTTYLLNSDIAPDGTGYVQPNPPTGKWCNFNDGMQGTCSNGLCINNLGYACSIMLIDCVMQAVGDPGAH